MPPSDHRDQVQSTTLGAFLKSLRRRIHREVGGLGPYERDPSRRGMRVTQQEIAAAAGVSRVWYATLESDAPIRASMGVLSRLADVLMLGADERDRLIRLAVPELEHFGLSDDSADVLGAFSFMRAAAKRLWTATSESEALAEASELLATWFRDVAQIASARRLASGVWENRLLEVAEAPKRFEEAIQEVSVSFTTAADVDEVHVFPQLLQPGETGLLFRLYSPRMRRAIDDTLARYRLGSGSYDSFLARVRSRRGLIACLGLYHVNGQVYSETDSAILSAVAEVTSLALS